MSAPSRIVVLPPALANQIAAGEVVERPASVIKELVENSIDAGATRIDVDVERGGLGLIRVSDNGCGMTQEEATLSFERHATSKLKTSEDLFHIQTLGFRGEALPSIASVSKCTLITRTQESLAGTEIHIHGGNMVSPAKEVGCAVGTQVEIRDLFYNVPARLKFMKSETTEYGHIQETLIRLALSFPSLHITLRKEGRLVLDLPPHNNQQERAQAALHLRGQLHDKAPILYPAIANHQTISVEAYLSAPHEDASSARNLYLFVNQRFIRDRALLSALTEAYGTTLEKGRFPMGVLHVKLPPSDVDVNVHPQKLEARFRQPSAIYAAVYDAAHQLLFTSPWLLSSTAKTEASSPRPDNRSGSSMFASEPRPTYGGSQHIDPRRSLPIDGPQTAFRPPSHTIQRVRATDTQIALPNTQDGEQLAQAAQQLPLPRLSFGKLLYLGQLLQTYLVCQGQDELILIDQHAAHERIAFERLLAAQSKAQIKSQRLLFPMNLTFDPKRATLVEDHLAELEAFGFSLAPFGSSHFALSSMPDMAEFGRGAKIYSDPKVLLEKVLDDLESFESSNTQKKHIEQVFATIACHSVVRAGDTLDPAQAKALLFAMDEIPFAPYCPHGRPVLVRTSRKELEKKFGRVS